MVEFLGNLSAESSVTDFLRRRILTGELTVGEKLRQTDIAVELGVSTTPVREAFRSLVAEGLVEIDTHRGATIRRLTPGEIIEVLELQGVIQIDALRYAVPRMTVEILAEAESVHRRMVRTKDPTEWSMLNGDFHLALASASERRRSLRILRELFNVGMIQLRQDIETWKGRRAEGETEHAQMIEAVRNKDVRALNSLVRHHVGVAIEHLRAEEPTAQR